jgi:hypothetical protein
MIELNFCGFNYNLKKNIINRGIDEYKISVNDSLRQERFSSMDSSDLEIDA